MDMRVSSVHELLERSSQLVSLLAADGAVVDTLGGTSLDTSPEINPEVTKSGYCKARDNWTAQEFFQGYPFLALDIPNIDIPNFVVLRNEISLDIRIGSDYIREIHFPPVRK